MDTKITLRFDEEVIIKAKNYAKSQGMSLSRLTEFLYRRISENNYTSLEDIPISDWVSMVAEGALEYSPKNKSNHKKDYYESRK